MELPQIGVTGLGGAAGGRDINAKTAGPLPRRGARVGANPPGGAAGPGPCMRPPPPPPAPPPLRVLKDSGAGSALNKCPWRKLSGAKGAIFFFILCVYTQNSQNFVDNSYLC